MAWNLTLLFVHLAALSGFAVLYRSAPCWMQKLVVVGLIVAMSLMSFGFLLAVLEVWGHWHVVGLGLAIEHLSVLLYVFRLIHQGHLEWNRSSANSHNSSAS